jgi:hypothetical protein
MTAVSHQAHGRSRAATAGPRKRERGIALVISLALITLMTALVVETNDRASQKLLQASRQRDATQAYYLANTGVNLYLLILTVGNEVQRMLGPYQQFLPQGTNLSEALWRTLPFLDSGLLRMVMSGASEEMDEEGINAAAESGSVDMGQLSGRSQQRLQETRENDSLLRRDFLAFDGDFRAELLADEGGLNVNLLATLDRPGKTLEQNPAARALYGVFSKPEYREVFRDELKMTPWELIANIKDWADPDSQGSGPLSADENRVYQDAEIPYEPKNAAFLTHRELQLVAGMTDHAYGLFGPALKTWGNRVNVNAASNTVLASVLAGFMRNVGPNTHGDVASVLQQMKIDRLMMPYPNVASFLSEFESDYASKFQTPANQLWYEATARSELERSLLTTEADFFTIRSTGFVGDSERTIEVAIYHRGREFHVLQWQEY